MLPFVPTSRDYRELLEQGTISTAGHIHLLDLDSLAKEEKHPPTEFCYPQFDIVASLPFELVSLVAAHLDPIDLVSSRRVSTEILGPCTDERTSLLNLIL